MRRRPLFDSCMRKSDTRAQMASEVYVGPKVLQSNIHTVGFLKKYIQNLPILIVYLVKS